MDDSSPHHKNLLINGRYTKEGSRPISLPSSIMPAAIIKGFGPRNKFVVKSRKTQCSDDELCGEYMPRFIISLVCSLPNGIWGNVVEQKMLLIQDKKIQKHAYIKSRNKFTLVRPRPAVVPGTNV